MRHGPRVPRGAALLAPHTRTDINTWPPCYLQSVDSLSGINYGGKTTATRCALGFVFYDTVDSTHNRSMLYKYILFLSRVLLLVHLTTLHNIKLLLLVILHQSTDVDYRIVRLINYYSKYRKVQSFYYMYKYRCLCDSFENLSIDTYLNWSTKLIKFNMYIKKCHLIP